MKEIDGKKFTIIGIEDSDYSEGGNTTPGVKITTEEEFEIDGVKMNKFHTTRMAVVQTLSNATLREKTASGQEKLVVKCESQKSKNGRSFFKLVEA